MISTFGDKNIFAIDYRVNKHSPMMMGYIRIWIRGIPLGSFEDEVPLLNVQHYLNCVSERLDAASISQIEEIPHESSELFKMMLSLLENGKFMMNPGESFDDFATFVIKDGEILRFIWKLQEDPFFEYPGYPKQVQTGLVDKVYFLDIVSQADLFIQKEAKEKAGTIDMELVPIQIQIK